MVRVPIARKASTVRGNAGARKLGIPALVAASINATYDRRNDPTDTVMTRTKTKSGILDSNRYTIPEVVLTVKLFHLE